MLVKKEKLKRFLETKNLFKEKFAALHSGLHGSPFITIQAQRVNLYPICSRRVPLPSKTHFIDFDKMVENIFGL